MNAHHIYFMGIALEEAETAGRMDEVPVGAVIVDGDGKITENVKAGEENDVVTEEVTFVVEEMEIA